MNQKNKGFILKLTKVKEKDVVATIFTQTQGKQSYYIHSVNTPKSKRKQRIEIMNLVEFTTSTKSTGQLKGVNKIDLIDNFRNIKEKKNLYAESFCLAEILYKTLPEAEPHNDVFLLLESACRTKLQKANISKVRAIFNYICINILFFLGFLPEIDIDQNSYKKLDPEKSIMLNPNEIGYLNGSGSSDTKKLIQIIKIQKFYLNTCPNIDKIVQLDISPDTNETLTQIQLDWFEYIIEKALKSRFLFKSKALRK